jgi:hypothetical protein
MGRARILPIAALLGAWLLFAVPFVAVGPNDVEDFYTAVATTKMTIDSMAEGAWPFWNMDSMLGVPQPFRFHFITHPLSPLCRVGDCAEVLRGIAALHVLIGAAFTMLLLRRLTSDDTIAALAGVTFLFSSSIVQTTYVDDWATTAIREASLPVLVYAAWALLRTDRSLEALKWALVLGGTAGLLLSMSFPFAVFIATATFLLVQPWHTWSRRQWILLAAAVGVIICAAHVYHLAEQYRLTPASVRRDDHEESSLLAYVWSTFLRPLPVRGVDPTWRSIFFGGPMAIAAMAALVACRDAALRPFKRAFVVSVLLMWVPVTWLLNLMTQQWGYRAGVNLFGIVLGSYALARLRRHEKHRWVASAAMGLQVVVLVAAFWPMWSDGGRAWREPRVMERSKRVLQTGGIAGELVALEQAHRGRVAFAPHAYDLTRRFLLARAGLVPNLLQMWRVPSLYAETHGITTDALSPMDYAFIGKSPPTSTTVTTPATLDVLGVRYVLAMPEDQVSDGLRLVRTGAEGVRIFENPEAWPEAFFVADFPRSPVPRLASCDHDRFLCADFARAGIEREPEPVTIDRHRDGLTLHFAASSRPRRILVTQWYQPYWRVVDGTANVVRAGEQLVGLEIPAGQERVTIEYLPVVRATLFFGGLAAELIVLALILWLWLSRRPASTPLEASAAVR